MHDIGLILRKGRDGQVGFEVIVGGATYDDAAAAALGFAQAQFHCAHAAQRKKHIFRTGRDGEEIIDALQFRHPRYVG